MFFTNGLKTNLALKEMVRKIVYFANANSIHDIKWISYFSEKPAEYSCYLQCDSDCKIDSETRLMLESKNILLLPSIVPFSISSPIKTIKSILRFRKTVREINPDFIHVLFTTPHALWLNFVKQKSILTMRGSDILIVIPDLLKQKGIKKIYFNFLFALFRSAFLKANYVTGTSKAQIEKAASLFKNDNLKLVRTGVDVSSIDSIHQTSLLPESLLEKDFVFSPRFMSTIYNIELQLNAIALLDQRLLDQYTFVFIRGKQFEDFYYQRQLQKLETLKESRNLQFLVFEYLDQPTMWTMMKNAALCVMTPKSDGTPNSALEAMSAKCPLIVSDLNYDQDLFHKTCLKIDNTNPIDLSEKIDFALNSYSKEMVNFAFEQVKMHGNRHVEMEKLEALYKRIS